MRLQQRQARETGICPVRRELYSQCFGKSGNILNNNTRQHFFPVPLKFLYTQVPSCYLYIK